MKRIIQELQRRNVIKSALAYLVFAWIITQVASIILPTFGAPVYLVRTIIFILVIGFPFWLIFAWVYEITPDGIKKTVAVVPEESITPQTSNRLNKIIIGALAIAILLLIFNIFNQNQVAASTPMDNVLTETPEQEKSIAVLAFADMSANKDQEYFSDGISEEILNLLAKLPNLKVISRTSSFSYKNKEQNIKKIGEELQVSHVLEGSVRKAGNTFRITTQLIDIKSGAHIWSETYDRNIEDIFKIQDEIAAKVIQRLKVTLLGNKFESTTVNTDAYNLYLQAKQLRTQNSSEGNNNALKLIQESIAIDSLYAPAWALYSECVFDSAFSYVKISIEDAISIGKPAAQKAIELDPKFAIGYLRLADFENASWNFKKETELIQKAVVLDMHHPEVIKSQSNSQLTYGKKHLAIALQLKILDIDPLTALHHYNLGLFYWIDENYHKAEAALNHYLLLNPNSEIANNMMAQIQLSLNNPIKALEFVEKDTDPFWKLYRKSMVVYAMNNKPEADRLLNQLIAEWGNDSWPNIAHVYAFRGNKDEAFKWLNLALENKDVSLLEILNYPEIKILWGDPRWNKFINKLGLPEDHGFHRD